MKLTKKQKVSASATDSLANMSVVGIYQTVEDAVTELLGELGFDNIEYVRFMLNTYSVRELETRPVKGMEILYTNQSFEGDVLTIHRGSFEGKDVFLLQKEAKVVARGEIVFETEKKGEILQIR